MRPRTKIAAGALASLALAGGVMAVGRSSASTNSTDGTVAETTAIRTSTVQRSTLTDEQRYDGTIQYSDVRSISAAGSDSGTTTGAATTGSVLTAVSRAGDTLERGAVAFEVDSNPTVVLYGDTPMYRDLSTAAEPGDDIRILEENLAVLGYDEDGVMAIDENYDDATAAAVERWEIDLGIEPDGVARRADVVILPGQSTVANVNAEVGDTVGGGAVIDVALISTEHHVLVSGVVTDDGSEISNVFEGDSIAAGDVLYDLDDVSVIALTGVTSLTRAMGEGTQGPDVRQLQENLLAMGYDEAQSDDDEESDNDDSDEDEDEEDSDDAEDSGEEDSGDEDADNEDEDANDDDENSDSADSESEEPLAITGTFDAATREAVEEMQFDAGQEVDGVVDLGDVAVVPPGMVVVDRLDTTTDGNDDVDASPHSIVLTLATSQRIVEVELAMEDQDELLVGTEVRVAVPGGGDTRGVVASVDSTAVAASGAGAETAAESATVTVTIEVLDEIELAQLQAPVDVYVTETLADSVLVVPVSALVALVDGGFAVQIVDAGAPGGLRYVAVEPGAFADNMVEVSGEGIDDSTQVVIA